MLRLAADENLNNDIIRGLLRRQPDIDLIRVQDVGLSGAGDPAVLEWAAREEERPPTTEEIFITYYESRQKGLTKLENLPLRDWWRTGEHEEFGTLTIKQQASYFASHEVTHFPQIESLINHLK